MTVSGAMVMVGGQGGGGPEEGCSQGKRFARCLCWNEGDARAGRCTRFPVPVCEETRVGAKGSERIASVGT